MLTLSTSLTWQQMLLAYGSALLTLLALDAIWLGVLMGSTYRSYLGEMMLTQPRLIPAALFYLLYSTGMLVFGIVPALRTQSWQQAVMLCALLGLVAYGTYDLSNLATLKAWPVTLTVIDICWGALVSGIAGTVGYVVASRI
ncbi:DUF2177 family protein [Undibacterium sp. Ji49W]|uniref:DUF2177 family protein n=1 Tax=Undibacterium sp. Ji49W TaxID=3413040 RepID=UPI003BF40A34